MADDCLPQVHAVRMRVCDLDTNGVPLPGPDSQYVTSALTTLTLDPQIRDGDEIEEPNGAGDICVSYQGDPALKWLTATFAICTPDPYLEAKLGRGAVLDMGPGVPAGGAYPEIGPIVGGAVSIELWSRRVNNGDMDPDYPYAWWAIPKVVQLRPQSREFGNASQKPSFVGRVLENHNWFDGPSNTWPAASDRVAQWVPCTPADMPDAQCGPAALVPS